MRPCREVLNVFRVHENKNFNNSQTHRRGAAPLTPRPSSNTRPPHRIDIPTTIIAPQSICFAMARVSRPCIFTFSEVMVERFKPDRNLRLDVLCKWWRPCRPECMRNVALGGTACTVCCRRPSHRPAGKPAIARRLGKAQTSPSSVPCGYVPAFPAGRQSEGDC